jgi:CheY-like chemotaxis protein
VDDDEAVRQSVAMTLQFCGHFVEPSDSGEDALDRIERSRFDLVITDFNMPGMKGDRLAHELKRRQPSLPVVLLTGNIIEHGSADVSMVLEKPFSLEQIRRMVSSIT